MRTTNTTIQNFFVTIPDVYWCGLKTFVMKSDRFFIYNLATKPLLPIRDYRVFLLYKSNFFKREQAQLHFSAKKLGIQWCQHGKMIGMVFRSGVKREKRRVKGKQYMRMRSRLAYSYRGGRAKILLLLKKGQMFLAGRFRMNYFLASSKKLMVQLMKLFLFRKPFVYKVKGFYRWYFRRRRYIYLGKIKLNRMKLKVSKKQKFM